MLTWTDGNANAVTRLDLSTATNQIYWSDRFTGRILRASLTPLDPNGPIAVLVEGAFFNGTGPQTPFGLRIDTAGGKMYWADTTNNKIQRANLDGTVVEDIVVKSSFSDPAFKFAPFGLAIDTIQGRLYWTSNSNTPAVQSAALDGTAIVTHSTLVNDPLAVAFQATSPAVSPCSVALWASAASSWASTQQVW